MAVTSACTLAHVGNEVLDGLQPRSPPAGQPEIVGGWLSVTVTVKLQEAEPQVLLAVQVTVLTPTGKAYGEVTTVPTGSGPPVILH